MEPLSTPQDATGVSKIVLTTILALPLEFEVLESRKLQFKPLLVNVLLLTTDRARQPHVAWFDDRLLKPLGGYVTIELQEAFRHRRNGELEVGPPLVDRAVRQFARGRTD